MSIAESAEHFSPTSRDEFIVRGPGGGFVYPYRSELAHAAYMHTWQHESYDPSQLIAALKLPVLEIGGPTIRGFMALEDAEMSYPPIITDVFSFAKDPDTGIRMPTNKFADLDRLALNAVADVRALPFAPESVGVMLGSCLPIVSYDAELLATTSETDDPVLSSLPMRSAYYHDDEPLDNADVYRRYSEYHDDLAYWINEAHSSIAQQLECGSIYEELITKTVVRLLPRVALQLAAIETLIPGGFLIMRGVRNPIDMAMAEAIGLEIVAISYDKGMDTLHSPEVYHEMVFRKPYTTELS